MDSSRVEAVEKDILLNLFSVKMKKIFHEGTSCFESKVRAGMSCPSSIFTERELMEHFVLDLKDANKDTQPPPSGSMQTER